MTITSAGVAVWDNFGPHFPDTEGGPRQDEQTVQTCKCNVFFIQSGDSVHHKVRSSRSTASRISQWSWMISPYGAQNRLAERKRIYLDMFAPWG